MLKFAVKRLIRDEKGQAMALAVILFFIGGLIVPSLLSYMGTALNTGNVYERGTAELYAADAGVENAVWKIQQGIGLCPGNPSTTYNITDVNGKSVEVTITLVNNLTSSITYKITSIATTNSNSHTTVESYVDRIIGGELNIFSGVLSSKGDINFISYGSTVTGDIYYGGTLDPNFTHISGNETRVGLDAFPTAAQDLAFAQMLKSQAMAGGTYNGNMNINSNITLNSTYITGNLNINSDFSLAGVVYVKGSISASKDIAIYGAGSSIALVAEGSITFEKLGTVGNTDSFIIMSLSSSGIYFKKEATLSALIYAPNGPIYFNKDATVTGGIVGADITVKKDASLTYVGKGGGFDLPGQLPGRVTIQTYNVSQ